MLFLGQYKAGAIVKYRGNFHNDQGTAEDPTSPAAELEKPDDSFTALTTPAKINSKAGHYGGSIDTAGFATGQHIVRMSGTVTTAKVIAAEFCFAIIGYDPTLANLSVDVVKLLGAAWLAPAVAGTPDVNAKQLGGVAQTGRDIGANVLLSSGSGAGQVSLSSGSVTVGTNNDKTGYGLSSAAVQAIWDALTSALTAVGSIGKLLVDNVNATISSRFATAGYTAPDNATIAAIDAKTANLPTDPADESLLEAAILTRLATASYTAPPTAAVIADQVWDETLADHLGVGGTGAALNAAGSAGDPWSTALPGAYGAGTAGKIVGDNVNATISSRSSHSAADVWAVGSRTITAFSFAVDISAGAVALIWAALTSGMSTVGSIGKKLSDWVVGTIDTYTGNTKQTGDAFARLGVPAGASTAADIAALKVVADAVKAKTDNLPSDPADQSLVIAATDAVMTRLGAPAGPSVSADIAAIDGGLDAAGVRTALGLAAANLDTQLGAVQTVVDGIASNALTGDEMADAILDRSDGIETGLTVREGLRIAAAADSGKLSGATTTTIKVRSTTDTKDRITATVDSDGNRTAVVRDLT